jgi:hypothetical protein
VTEKFFSALGNTSAVMTTRDIFKNFHKTIFSYSKSLFSTLRDFWGDLIPMFGPLHCNLDELFLASKKGSCRMQL